MQNKEIFYEAGLFKWQTRDLYHCTNFVPIEKRFMKAYEGQTPRGGKPRGSFRMEGGTMVQKWFIWRESRNVSKKLT